MDLDLKWRFLEAWGEHFGDADLPVALWYSEDAVTEPTRPQGQWNCFMNELWRAQHGENVALDAESVRCFGGKRFLGFTREVSPNLPHFLSCGIPGKLEGERYKKTPEIARAGIDSLTIPDAPARYLNARRWDLLEEADAPGIIVFLAEPDVLSGLFTLANFDRIDPHGVITPFSSGCGSTVTYPSLERTGKNPRAVLGMFDPSARPYVGPQRLSFAVPMERFATMVDSMPESFLIAPAWAKVRSRIGEA